MRFPALILAALLTLAMPFTATGATHPIPKADYPAGAHIIYNAAEDAGSWNCDSAFDCSSGDPWMHSNTANNLNRTGGWLQAAKWPHHRTFFAVFFNTWATQDDALFALQDSQITMNGFYRVKVWKKHVYGETSWQGATTQDGFGLYVIEVALPNGTDIEADSVYALKNKAAARECLMLQVRDAIAVACQSGDGCPSLSA